MQKKLTITVETDVYEGLHRVIGRGQISSFIERLVRPHVIHDEIEDSFRALAQYEAETGADEEALEWSEALIADVADEPR
jgi:predicted CopG family antitoxin